MNLLSELGSKPTKCRPLGLIVISSHLHQQWHNCCHKATRTNLHPYLCQIRRRQSDFFEGYGHGFKMLLNRDKTAVLERFWS